jgi:hypothetical protein
MQAQIVFRFGQYAAPIVSGRSYRTPTPQPHFNQLDSNVIPPLFTGHLFASKSVSLTHIHTRFTEFVMHVAHARAQHRSRSRRIGYECWGPAGKAMHPMTRIASPTTV